MENKPTSEQIIAGMNQKFGEGMPKMVEKLAELSPESLLVQITSSSDSMSDANSPFEPKFRTFIYLAAALATNNQTCIKAQFHAALKQGASQEEMMAVVKIVRHAASSGTYGNAAYILDNLSK